MKILTSKDKGSENRLGSPETCPGFCRKLVILKRWRLNQWGMGGVGDRGGMVKKRAFCVGEKSIFILMVDRM